MTKLTRDVSSGMASQEVNFWASLEWALEGMEAQLRSEDMRMVMDALRNANRFHAIVSFIADTGLKDATDLCSSLFFFFGINEANGYRESTGATLSAKQSPLLYDFDKVHDH